MMHKSLSVVMAVSNPITLNFPFEECVKSILQIADEIIIVTGDDKFFGESYNIIKQDDLLNEALRKEIIKIYWLPWRENFRKNMELLAKSAAISQATKDYVLLLDCITKNRNIVIKYNNKIDVLSVESLFLKFKDSVIITPDGKEVIENINDLYTLSTNRCFKIDEYEPQEDIYNKYKDNKDFKFLMENGTDSQIYILNLLNNNLKIKKDVHYYNSIRSIEYKIKNKLFYRCIPSWNKINKIIRHKSNKKVYRISNAFGEIEISEDHSLIDIKNNEYIKSVMEGNNIISMLETPIIDNITILDLSEYVNMCNLYVENDYIKYKSNNKITNFIGVKSKYDLNNDADKEDLLSFCRVLGFFVAEGSTNNQDFSLPQKNRDILYLLFKELYKITINCGFRLTCSYRKDKKSIMYYLRSSSTILLKIFSNLCGEDSNSKKIPSFIYQLPDLYKNEFINFYLKGDGHINKLGILSCTTKSLNLASGLSFLFKTLKIKHSFSFEIKRGKRYYQLRYLKNNYTRGKGNSKLIIENIKYDDYLYDLQVKDTNIFADACGSILLHNCDEIIHEDDYVKIKQCMELGKDAYSFRTLHFYRDYNHHKIPNSNNYWYNHRPKLFKNGLGIWDGYQSWIEHNTVNYEDIATLKTEYTADLVTWDYKPVHSFSEKTSITIYHYGYVRNEEQMLLKQNNIEKRYHPDFVEMKEWIWKMDDCVEYTGTHPKVMDSRITLHQCHYHDIYKTTICKDNHKQFCPDCNCLLQTITDHFGGGSHYWHLVCNKCKKEYYWDTYRMELELVKDKIEENL